MILFLRPRSLPLEREAEFRAPRSVGTDLALVVPPGHSALGKEGVQEITVPFTTEPVETSQQVLKALGNLRRRIRGVVAWIDSDVELAAHLTSCLGLPGTAPEAAARTRNKALLRECLESVPGANPRYFVVHDEAGFLEGLDLVGFPAVLKPVGASGGRGIFWIETKVGALETYREFERHCVPERDSVYSYSSGVAVLEERIVGTEHSAAGFVFDARVYVTAIADKRIDRMTRTQYITYTPTCDPVGAGQSVHRLIRESVSATGIDWCGFHVDFILTRTGARILEIGGRLGGDCINSHLIPLAFGMQPYELLLDVVQGIRSSAIEKLSRPAVADSQAALLTVHPRRFGRIANIDGLEKFRTHPNLRALHIAKTIGDQVYHPREKYNEFAIAYAVLEAQLGKNIGNLAEQLNESIEVGIESNTDVLDLSQTKGSCLR